MNAFITIAIIILSRYFTSCLHVQYCSNTHLTPCIKYDACTCKIDNQKLGCKLTCRNVNDSFDLFFNSEMNDVDVHSEGVPIIDVEITLNNLSEINATYVKNFETVKVLNLSYNELRTVAPDTFHDLISLKSLDLSHNSLSHVPDGLLRSLTMLKYLNLADNQIQHIDTSCLRDLEMLIKLNMSRNTLAEIPENLFSNTCKLKVLSLAYNEIYALPDKIFSKLIELEVLDLSNNQLTRLQPPLFESLKSLHYLSISHNQLKRLEKETFDHINATLTYIDISGNLLNCGESNYWIYLWLQEDPDIFKSPLKLRCQNTEKQLNRTFFNDFEIINTIRSIQKCNVCTICECKRFTDPVIVTVDCRNRNLKLLPQELPYRTKKVFLDNNKITSLNIEDKSINSWSYVSFLGLNNNSISSFHVFGGLPFFRRIVELNITGNKLKDIPLHLLDQFSPSMILHLADNPWTCNCNTIRFQIWLQNHHQQIMDIKNIRCAADDKYTSNQVIYSMKKSELCPRPSKSFDYLDILNITMGLLIFLIISKVIYDYWHQKKTGKLPKFFGINLP